MMILVTGATGAVGPRVVAALHDGGFRVRTLSLDPPEEGDWPRDVEARTGDVTDLSDVQDAMKGVDTVVHLAALLHIVNPPPALQERYEQINVGGTARVVEAAVKAGVRRVVLFSTIAVYGRSEGRIMTEDSPAHPDTFYARTKRAAEQLVLEAKHSDGTPIGTVLRLGAVYGSRIKGNYERLTQALAHHRFVPVGDGRNRRTLVYDKDVGRAALLAVSHPAAAGRVFNVTDGTFHSLNEIIESICAALGRRPPRMSVPAGIARSATSVIEGGFRMFGLEAPVTSDMIVKYAEDIAVDGRRIQTELGFVPQYDLQAGWAETIREMRWMGSLG